jgi:hypothetical protein
MFNLLQRRREGKRLWYDDNIKMKIVFMKKLRAD